MTHQLLAYVVVGVLSIGAGVAIAGFVAPIEDVPSVADLSADIELPVYIGRDRA